MIKDLLMKDLKHYMKERNQTALNSIKSVNNEIRNTEIDLKKDLIDKEIISIIKKQIKMRKDSIEQYDLANRKDLSEKEKEEISYLEKYLPQQMNEQQISEIIKETKEELNINSTKEFGNLMKAVMEKTKGKADGSLVSKLVKKELS